MPHKELIGQGNGSVDEPPPGEVKAPQLYGSLAVQVGHDQLFQQDASKAETGAKQQPQ